MITRWHLKNLPVSFSNRRAGGRIVEVLMEWPEPTIWGFVLHRSWRVGVLPYASGVVVTPFGLYVPPGVAVQKWSRARLRSQLANTAHWLHASLVDPDDNPLGMVRDLVLDSGNPVLQGLIVSRGLLHDLWTGALIVSLDQISVTDNGCMKMRSSGQTVGEQEAPQGGDM